MAVRCSLAERGIKIYRPGVRIHGGSNINIKLLFFIIVSGLWREGDKNLACRAADREILNGPYRPSQSSPLYPIPSHINLQTKLHTFSDKITHISRQNYTHFQTKLHTFSDKITHISTKLHTFLFFSQNYTHFDKITHV